MTQRKICLLGAFAAGKTSLVRRFVQGIYSEEYHTTIGVKIDRKVVHVGDRSVTALVWDLAGDDEFSKVRPSYLRGAAGLLFVVDGTRAGTVDAVVSLSELAGTVVGDVPTVIAINKVDLIDQWELPDSVDTDLAEGRRTVIRTSAKTGAGVAEAFQWLAEAMTATE